MPTYSRGYLHLLALFILTALILTITYFFYSHSFTGTKTVEAQSAKPNILVIMTDDQDVDSLPVMRNLIAYPEGSWVKFNNAFASDSLCCPSRATFFSGKYSHITGVTDNGLGWKLDDTNLLPVWLHNGGYKTGLVGKYLNLFPWDRGKSYVPPGWDSFNITGAGNPDNAAKNAISFINANASRPFFFFVGITDPHQPAEPLERYATASAYVAPNSPNFNEADVSDKPGTVKNAKLLDQATIDSWATERLNSQRALLGVDDAIASIVAALKTNGILDNTMVIFTTDHGFSWGSHRLLGKHCFYEECSKIPLFIRYPGLVGNREENRIVSNVDFASTISEYAGVTPTLNQSGVSFLSVINGTASNWNEDILLERGGVNFGIRVPDWMYAEYPGTPRELYDLTNDPFELQNIAGNAAYSSVQADLAQRLHSLKGTVNPSPTPSSTPTPPLVTLDNISNGILLAGNKSVKVKVTDTEAGVRNVDLLADDLVVGTINVSPYNILWNTKNGADGSHNLTAKVYDTIGNIYTSDPVTVTVDNTGPATILNNPIKNAVLSGSVLLTASASDNSGIKTVKFLADSLLLQTLSVAPYQYSLDTTTLVNGKHTLRVTATDIAGNSTSASVAVTIQN